MDVLPPAVPVRPPRPRRLWPWVFGAVAVILSSAVLGVALYIHSQPTVGKLESALARAGAPRHGVLGHEEADNTCFGWCPAVHRWYALPGSDPEVAVAAFGRKLTAAGFSYRPSSGPRQLPVWVGFGAAVSLQGFRPGDPQEPPGGAPPGVEVGSYLLVQAWPEHG